jgi:hypothetical protein
MEMSCLLCRSIDDDDGIRVWRSGKLKPLNSINSKVWPWPRDAKRAQQYLSGALISGPISVIRVDYGAKQRPASTIQVIVVGS